MDPGLLLRALLAVAVVVQLGRVARVAWQRRDLALAIWGAVTPAVLARAVVLALGLVALLVLLLAVPGMDRGLGDLVGLSGNVVFAPVEVGLEIGAPRDGRLVEFALTTAFLGALVLLLPWLAFVEELLFRAGSEVWGWRRRATTAAVFGAVHLLVLVPLGAAVALTSAGLVYDVAYRRAFADDRARVPVAALRSFRATRRAGAALPDGVAATPAPATDADGLRRARSGHRRAQARGAHAAAVLHTATNTVVVATVWLLTVLPVA